MDPNPNPDPSYLLAIEQRAHAVTRALLVNVVQELAGATLSNERLVAALGERGGASEPQEGSQR